MNSNSKRWMMRVMTVFLLIFTHFLFSAFSACAEVKPGEIFPMDEIFKPPDSLFIRLHDPFTFGTSKSTQANVQEFKPMPGEKVRVVIKKAKDLRAIKKMVAGNRYTPIMLENDAVLSDLFTENLTRCFEIAGYEVIPLGQFEATLTTNKEAVKAIIDSEIISFWVSSRSDFPGLLGSVTFKIGVYEPKTNQEIWSEMFTGGSRTYPFFPTREKVEKSINLAYAEAMKKLYRAISDEKFKTLLRKK